jgi:hypothetical protein
MAQTIYDVWSKLDQLPKDKIIVAFGNEYHGTTYDSKEELLKNYRRILKNAIYQDCSIYVGGELKRSLRNFNQKVTNKTVQYQYEVVKY